MGNFPNRSDRDNRDCVTSDRPKNPDELPPPTLVEDDAALGDLLDVLDSCTEAAVDTEADSFFSYKESVCLLQVTAAGRDYVIDPLVGLNLDGFGRFLADERKVKVFHDGEFDVLIMKREYDFDFANLFDTRVAASALGSTSPGLGSVLAEHFGFELDKSMQRSDWSRRPLSSQQIRYARLDTHYLLPLMRIQQDALDEARRTMVLEGECRRLEALEASPRNFDPDGYAKLKGVRTLNPLGRRVLRELFVWRDGQASARNLPPFKVLGNNILLSLAAAMPVNEHELSRCDGMSPKVARRLGSKLLDVVDGAERMEPIEQLPRLPSKDGTDVLNEEGIELHERLKKWRKDTAIREEMDSSLVLNRRSLLGLAEHRPRGEDELPGINGMMVWQSERYGRDLIDLVAKFEGDLEAGDIDFSHRGRRRS
ncbi:MAG: ribonuclease D [Planctomycetota bacterium]